MRLTSAALFTTLAVALSACGTKGPLYIPAPAAKAGTTASAPAPAAKASIDDNSQNAAGSKP